MTDNTQTVKSAIANLKNVAGAYVLMERLRSRTQNMPGFGVIHGRSGYGKTFSAIFMQNKTDAIRVEMNVSWTRKTLLEKILVECGLSDRELPRTEAKLTDRAMLELSEYPDRPLIIDEADVAVDKNMIQLVRGVQDSTGVAVLLIGEGLLLDKIERASEQAFERILDRFEVQPCDQADTAELAGHYCAGVAFAEDLLEELRTKTSGITRRICVNLEHIREYCANNRVGEMDLEQFRASGLPLFVGARTTGGRG